jgi:hypothetical protein
LRASLKPVDEMDHVWNRPRAPKRMQLLAVANGEMDLTQEASLEHERAKTELVVGSQEMTATESSEGDRATGALLLRIASQCDAGPKPVSPRTSRT